MALNWNHCKSLNSSSFCQTFGDDDDRAVAFWFRATGGDGNFSFIFPECLFATSPPFNYTDDKFSDELSTAPQFVTRHATAADNHSRCNRRRFLTQYAITALGTSGRLPARPREIGSMSWVLTPRTDVEVPEGARAAYSQPPSRPPALSTNGFFVFDPSLPVSASFDLIHFPHTNTLAFKTPSSVFIRSFIPGQLSLKLVLHTLASSNSPFVFLAASFPILLSLSSFHDVVLWQQSDYQACDSAQGPIW
jgi:hypothetical protein